MLAWLASLGPVGAFIAAHWDVLGFYAVVLILLYLFRKRFEFQGIVALLKTQFGVKFMTETGHKHPKFWDRVGLVAIVLGFLGMAFILCYLIWGLYALVFVPNAPPALSPVIPGVKIPGVPFTFPLWYTLGALFFSIIVHEAMHGVFASAYNIKIKSSGFAFLGPIPGAFVEPDEELMSKRSRRQQLAIIAGGPFANMVLFAVMLGLSFGIAAVSDQLIIHDGVSYLNLQNGSGAMAAGLPMNGTLTAIDGTGIADVGELSSRLDREHPGQQAFVTVDNQQYHVTFGESPDQKGHAFLGVLGVQNKTMLKNPSMGWVYTGLTFLLLLCVWTYIISLGVGIANLIPIFMVDGGRMALLALENFYDKERAKGIWTRAGFIILFFVIILVFVPIIRALL